MAVFRVEKNSGYTVMSNHHLRNRASSLTAKGLLSQMLSLPEDWDYTLQGLARINRESIDAIRQAIRELEQAGYIQRSRERDEKGRLRGADYVIFELPQPVPASVSPTLENPTLENPTQENPTLENPMQLNKDKKRLLDREKSFSALSLEELGQLTSVDHYPSEEFIFSSYGCDLHLDNELVANAFAALPKQEQSILILFCVLELGDGEIGDLMGMSRSAVQRHRTKTLNELRKKLKAHLPEGG